MDRETFQTGEIEIIQLAEGEFLWRWTGGDQIIVSDGVLNSEFVKWEAKSTSKFKFGPLKCEIVETWPEFDFVGAKIVSYRASAAHAVERHEDGGVKLSGGTGTDD